MIYNPLKCLHRLDADYRLFFDLNLTEHQRRNLCEECLGQPDSKPCHITLEDLLEEIKALKYQVQDLKRTWD